LGEKRAWARSVEGEEKAAEGTTKKKKKCANDLRRENFGNVHHPQKKERDKSAELSQKKRGSNDHHDLNGGDRIRPSAPVGQKEQKCRKQRLSMETQKCLRCGTSVAPKDLNT